MENQLFKVVLNHSDEIVRLWMDEVYKNREKDYTATISNELFESTNREFVNVIFSSIENHGQTNGIENFAERLIYLGWPLSYLTDGMQVFRRVTVHYILKQLDAIDVEMCMEIISGVDHWIDPIINQLVNEYSGSWEHTVSLQKLALQELSAPLIPVMDNITIMPLIGTIDTERAKLIMENLLNGVIKHRADVVLIDITGVPVVDTMVAHHIIQAAEAVRLIGSTCILVGIRPEIAQTIVNLGINLEKFPTKSSLKRGIETALELTNSKIVSISDNQQGIEEILDSLDRERGK
ncbi:RsbT co-antagonist protein RsbRA [Pontibacillus litoralis]|uniref:Positive regulator of sigma-B activity n=1 Tax=Pontibacillus litoralis JSM 072002 TaxID=1385512 RepID=A0A0A5G3G0_9BACI|nr:RsbT co-antagonist protein RsbRA [Pontibacillus litoralis]KGX86564.1 positive regulator of sigma-B activity [Pontibacillus litoralis JSM 072002]